jgi:gamma-glutamyltranspeptidase/glutathione hydrolase
LIFEKRSLLYIHSLTELERRVYADRATHLGDPDFEDIPVDQLLAADYNKERFSNINLRMKTASQDIKEGHVEVIESFETTHFSIIDMEGNAISLTTTLNGAYGCKMVVKGAGFLLNNEMDDFSIRPGHPNQFGLLGGEKNAIKPEKRMLSSMTPTIVTKDEEVFMLVGTPGGPTIITSVFQTILNVLDFDMTMQEAVNAKKAHAQWLPDRVYLEEGAIDSLKAKELESMGHELRFIRALGRMACILVRDDGSLEAAPDYLRSDGHAEGR